MHSQVIVFERAGLVFAFNFHTYKSFTDYPLGVELAGRWVGFVEQEGIKKKNYIEHWDRKEKEEGESLLMIILLLEEINEGSF